ncbi:MAG: ParB/RepB/Spo0J family partition protein [Oscillospiraceae bacterium]|jgi:ParB family chromosome partitioning protein|nr:ParB/RepB/Spo0J family partition protein [Oscillospiraceae bacterium]
MLNVKKRGLFETGQVVYLKIGEISADSETPRRDMPPGAMRELVSSVSKYGVLQPVSVRRADAGYELISGERRLRAAVLAGLEDIPCIVMDVSEQESTALVLVDNLQRRGLDFMEEARALSRLINLYGYSQEETARLVGRSQPAVANKLRILRLPDEVIVSLRAANLTERHARALLRLKGDNAISSALAEIIRRGYNVAQTDEYIDELLSTENAARMQIGTGHSAQIHSQESPRESAHSEIAIAHGHIRFFVGTLRRGIKLLQKAGVAARYDVSDAGTEIRLTIIIPKNTAIGNC